MAYVNLGTYYVIGLPIGCVLGFKTSLGVAVSINKLLSFVSIIDQLVCVLVYHSLVIKNLDLMGIFRWLKGYAIKDEMLDLLWKFHCLPINVMTHQMESLNH